ncbi:uncharacterized protein LOC116262824 [Nymphaea colorata]|nr:uncharacterized protein LOC116262824 [Nymphaea colorata]
MAEEEGTGDLSFSLRPFKIEDADDVMAWKGDPRVAAFCRWDAYTTRDEAVAFIQDFAIPHEWCRAICVAGRPVGCVSVTIGKDHARCRGLLKYELAHVCGGKGVATSAMRLAVPAVFREFLGLEGVEAMQNIVDLVYWATPIFFHKSRNTIRVLEKCGFLREGILRRYVVAKGRLLDLVMFSVLSEEIQP